MLIARGRVLWPIILVLCVGGLVIVWNGLTFDPKTFFAQDTPVPRYIFSFGDSFTTTGFDASSPSYPSLWNPLGNPDSYGNTTSGGPNWVGMIIRDLAPEATMLYNYARYGATIDEDLIAPITPEGRDLRYQVEQFKDIMTPRPAFGPWKAQNSAFVMWMGMNDVTLNNALNSIGFTPDQTITARILDTYLKSLDSMQVAGGRNFVLLTVPPVNRNPKFSQSEPSMGEKVGADIKAFNAKLTNRVQAWGSRHRGSNFRIVDTGPLFTQILDNPERYNATDAVCADPRGRSCLWADNFHPGYALQKSVARKVYEALDEMDFWAKPAPMPMFNPMPAA